MKKSVVAIIMLVVILAVAAFGVTAYASDWYQLPVDKWGDRLGLGSDEQPGETEDPDKPGEVVGGDGNVMDPTGVNVMPMAMTFNTASVSGATGSTVTITATISPDNATNKNVTWTIAWENPSSSWASGKTVTDYVTVTPNTSDSRIATVTCKQAFGEQVIITATAAGNTSIYQTCTADYEKRLQGMNGLTLNHYSVDLEYSLFDNNLTVIQPIEYCDYGVMNDMILTSNDEEFNEYYLRWINNSDEEITSIDILDRVVQLIESDIPVYTDGTIGGASSLEYINIYVENEDFYSTLSTIENVIDVTLSKSTDLIVGKKIYIEDLRNYLIGYDTNEMIPFSPMWFLSLTFDNPVEAYFCDSHAVQDMLIDSHLHSGENYESLFEQFENGDETELRSIADITLDFVMSDGTKITQYVIFDFSQYLIPISNITLDKGSIVF